LSDIRKQALICGQRRQMGFGKTASNKQAIHLGQLRIVYRIEGNELSACLRKNFEVIRVIKTEGSAIQQISNPG